MKNDLQLKEYVDALAAERLRLGGVVTLAVLAIIFAMNAGNTKATALALAGQEEATKIALDAANEKGVHHNGLIDEMRRLISTFVTKGHIYTALTTAISLGLLYLAFTK